MKSTFFIYKIKNVFSSYKNEIVYDSYCHKNTGRTINTSCGCIVFILFVKLVLNAYHLYCTITVYMFALTSLALPIFTFSLPLGFQRRIHCVYLRRHQHIFFDKSQSECVPQSTDPMILYNQSDVNVRFFVN